MRDEYQIVMIDPGGERRSHVLTVEARTTEEALLKVAVEASKSKPIRGGTPDYKLALQEYNADIGAWETVETMKAGIDGRWFC